MSMEHACCTKPSLDQFLQGQLLQIAGSSWIVPGPTNVGVFVQNDEAILIDSGNSPDAAKKIKRLLDEKNWTLKAIINTHANADHIGGNEYLQRTTGCKIAATHTEKAFIESPHIQSAFLWGGFAPEALKNKFFLAPPSIVTDVITRRTSTGASAGSRAAHESGYISTFSGLEFLPLPGHFFEMIGVQTSDNVLYLGDCMFGPEVLQKHRIPFVYDVAAYKQTIENVKNTQADFYVLCHGQIITSKTQLIEVADLNLALIDRIEASLLAILRNTPTNQPSNAQQNNSDEGLNFDSIFRLVCDEYQIQLASAQQALVGSTIRSFLTYLENKKLATCSFNNNQMLWRGT